MAEQARRQVRSMTVHFQMSDKVLAAFRRLRYAAESPVKCWWMPYGTLVWHDEHPGAEDYSSYLEEMGNDLDDPTDQTIHRLIIARQHIWHDGSVPKELNTFWTEARQAIPEWPGFRRLSLSNDQYAAVLACEADSREVHNSWLEAWAGDADDLETKDLGGLLTSTSFTVWRREDSDKVVSLDSSKAKPKERPWWRFWR